MVFVVINRWFLMVIVAGLIVFTLLDYFFLSSVLLLVYCSNVTLFSLFHFFRTLFFISFQAAVDAEEHLGNWKERE